MTSHYVNHEIETASRDALAQYQTAQIQNLLRQVLATNAFYGSKLREAGFTDADDFTSLADLASIAIHAQARAGGRSSRTSAVRHQSHGHAPKLYPLAQNIRHDRQTFVLARYARQLGLVGALLGHRLLRREYHFERPSLFCVFVWIVYRILGGLGRRRKNRRAGNLWRGPGFVPASPQHDRIECHRAVLHTELRAPPG